MRFIFQILGKQRFHIPACLMKVIDAINENPPHSGGRGACDMIKVAAAGSGIHDMQRNKLSPCYSTRIQDVITVKP